MYKILVIVHFEYAAMVATKAFLFTLIMMPILMFGGIVLMPQLGKLNGSKTRKIVVADGSGKLFAAIQAAAEVRNQAIAAAEKAASSDKKPDDQSSDSATNDSSVDDPKKASPKKSKGLDGSDFRPVADRWEFTAAPSPTLDDEQRMALSDQIRDGSLYAFLEIPADSIPLDSSNSLAAPSAEVKPPTFVSQDAVLSDARGWVQSILQQEARKMRLKSLGVDPATVAKADTPVVLAPTTPYAKSSTGSVEARGGLDALASIFLPFGIMMLMFMVIFLAAQPMLESGMEEKGQRIAEVLLGSVSPSQLMAGKLLGNVAGSLMIFLIYGIGGWLVLDRNGWAEALPWNQLPWFVVFQLLGVLFFSSIFLAVGASISDLKEAQSLLLPVWLVLMAPLMVWFVAVRDPNGSVATGLSFFPPSCPLMMALRLASGQTIPAWQPPVAALLLLVSTVVVVFLAGKIYRASLLRSDGVRSLGQLVKRLGW